MWSSRRAEASLGRRGEQLAAKLLRRKGMKILAESYRCRAGEIDLIALDGSTTAELGVATIAFVEVKARSSDEYASPESAVNARKRRRIRKAAEMYLATHDAGDLNARFDVVTVVAHPDGPQLSHIPDAF